MPPPRTPSPRLLFLEQDDSTKDISLYVNSPGGYITSGLAIYDTMQFVRPDVATYVIGQAASMAAVLVAGGTKGKRYALPNATLLVHQPQGGFQGPASDIEIHAKEVQRLKRPSAVARIRNRMGGLLSVVYNAL